ncbi:fluoride efflux transporter CrcB [Nocardioides alkalitolerans]|uniref:fluoride efflux transporter CrcB n=1 Tax=Nocardioides alkalitolerans TaxID=281714 RepID=UPI0003F9C6E0|nr:fluoride efflux transporter CrcB [Nocardioides alkalitolerans]
MTGELLFCAVALAGGGGAGLRFVVDGAVRARLGDGFPWGTWLVNLSGSFALGLMTGLAASTLLPDDLGLVLGTGLLGGYTTFSTAAVDTVLLAREGRHAAALLNGVGMLVVAVVAAAAGYALGA